MKQVSDRIVSLFLILAIVSTLGGFLMILATISGDFARITGFATTQTATVNVTIQATASMAISPTLIEFGSGTLSGGANGTAINTSGAGTNFGGFSKPSPINVTNDGNVDLNITINGSLPSTWLSSGSTYEWQGAAGVEAGSCPSTNLTTTRTAFANALTRVCANLTYSDAADTISIHIFLNLSSSLPAATYNDSYVLIRADRCQTVC